MLDKKIIITFREEVNKNSWCLFKYKNVNERNQWNCICSAMDWIDISVDYINSHDLGKIQGNQSIELYAFISCVDIIVESIEQLHRVFFSTRKAIFSKDRSCFPDNPFHQPDREYFKSIRACFGAHPVNLTDPENPNNTQSKRFASWSGGDFGQGDFSVVLYSNQAQGQNIFLGISFRQVENFLAKYYIHLTSLQEQIQIQYVNFCKEMKSRPIICTGTITERLEILKKENTIRLNNSYYKNCIENLIEIFSTEITCLSNRPMVKRYQEYLLKTVDELYYNLQAMTIIDLENDPDPDTINIPLPNGWYYWVEKLSDSVKGVGYPQFYYLSGLKKSFGKHFTFQYESEQELLVLVKAAIFDLASAKV